ncbi:MAG: hypothetical protein M3N14_04095, partial [Bacteroidota bacterium]|nr:hypothetical protein [Bacteroidota bacterium]
ANGTAPQLIFNETAKVATQNIGSNLFMSTRASMATAKSVKPETHLRLRLLKDSINTYDTYIGFSANASPKYIFNEDAPFKAGLGLVSIASMSVDNIPLAINKYPLPTAKSDTIFIKVNAIYTGTYTLNMSDMSSLPNLYEIWLKDAYTKDSVDMRQNAAYPFNLNLADTTTFGSRRFSLIIRENKNRRVLLMDFTAQKAITGVETDWKTENEKNYTIFTVERSTDKGITFSAIGGFTSGGTGSYSLVDKNPVIGQNQYRLKIENVNGKITYSKVVSVNYTVQSTGTVASNISVYPNPVVNKMTLVINPAGPASGITEISGLITARLTGVAKADEYGITIASNSGVVVKKAETNQMIWQADLSNLMPGSYVIQVVSKSGRGLIGQCVFIKL